MRRAEFDHVIVAAAEVSGESELVVIGSQAILGDGSWFHRTYGYYAHGVGPETAKAPAGWEGRLVVVEVPVRISSRQRAVALCMEPHDLVLAKCVAGRERDWEFAREALEHELVDGAVLLH